MKKFSVLILVLSLSLALFTPALAAGPEAFEDDAPYWTGYTDGYDAGYDDGFSAPEGSACPDEYADTMETYADGYQDGYCSGYDAGAATAQTDRDKAALGGVPGQVGVMVNGGYIRFADAPPRLQSGRVMAPLRPLMETLGARVSYLAETGAVECALDGQTLRFTIGGEDLLVRDSGGGEKTITMDCAAYAGENRVYVPVRFLAQALGYDAGWDDAFQTAVLTDPAAFMALVNPRFTVANGLLSAWTPDPSGQYKTTVSLTATYTVSGASDGGAYTMTADAQALRAPSGMEVTGTYDLSRLPALLKATMDPGMYQSMEDSGDWESLLPLLSGSYDLRMNRADAMLYLRMSLFPQLFALSGEPYPGDVWVSTGLPDVSDLFPWAVSENGPLTVGGILYGMDGPGMLYSSVYTWHDLSDDAETLAGLCGDSRFIPQGNRLVYTPGGSPEDYDLSMTVTGGDTLTGAFRPVSDSPQPDGGPSVSGDFTVAPDRSAVHLTFGFENGDILKLTFTAATAETSTRPAVTPPENAVVIPAEDL